MRPEPRIFNRVDWKRRHLNSLIQKIKRNGNRNHSSHRLLLIISQFDVVVIICNWIFTSLWLVICGNLYGSPCILSISFWVLADVLWGRGTKLENVQRSVVNTAHYKPLIVGFESPWQSAFWFPYSGTDFISPLRQAKVRKPRREKISF